MVSENFQSPNAIPPRTSSTGLSNGFHVPTKPVLRPVSEGDWIGGKLQPPEQPKSMHHESRTGDGTTWSTEKEKILLGPYDYLFDQPGKDIRTQLITAFNTWLRVPEESLKIITKVVGMLHTASLLYVPRFGIHRQGSCFSSVDDVEDSSLLRRGVPVAHSIFGTAQAINSANYVYFCALQDLLKLNNPQTIQIYTDELCNLHRGQGMDLFWRDTLTCPSEEDYLEMVGNKTGGLFRLAVKLMQAESKSDKSVNACSTFEATSH